MKSTACGFLAPEVHWYTAAAYCWRKRKTQNRARKARIVRPMSTLEETPRNKRGVATTSLGSPSDLGSPPHGIKLESRLRRHGKLCSHAQRMRAETEFKRQAPSFV